MKQLLTTLTLLFLVSSAWAAPQHGIEAHDPWVREAPPSAKVLAAYLQLHNHSDKMYTLISAESPAFNQVELHRTEEKNGMAMMIKTSKIMIAPHGKIAFEPGSLHIMLIGRLAPLKAGDKVAITLHFSDGSSLDVTAEVRRDAAGGMAHHHGTHKSMDMDDKHMDMKEHEHGH